MAKLLAYQRSAQQVVTVDTINNVVANLGNTLPTADVTDKFGLRTRDLIAVYKGDPYLLWRHAAGNHPIVPRVPYCTFPLPRTYVSALYQWPSPSRSMQPRFPIRHERLSLPWQGSP